MIVIDIRYNHNPEGMIWLGGIFHPFGVMDEQLFDLQSDHPFGVGNFRGLVNQFLQNFHVLFNRLLHRRADFGGFGFAICQHGFGAG